MNLEYSFGYLATLKQPPVAIGAGPYGMRMFFEIEGGRVEGPDIKGRLLGGGGDWILVGADGFGRLEGGQGRGEGRDDRRRVRWRRRGWRLDRRGRGRGRGARRNDRQEEGGCRRAHCPLRAQDRHLKSLAPMRRRPADRRESRD